MFFPLELSAGSSTPITLPDEIIDAIGNTDPLLPTITQNVENPLVKFLIWLAGLAVMLFLGIVITKIILSFSRRLLLRSKIDNTAIPFLSSVIKVFCYVVLGITILGSTGFVDTASLVTAFGAVGLAVSLAVKDSLSNLAGGALLLVNKPFALGDYVDIDSTSGTITEISLTYTILKTVDNKRICIPNGQVTNARIVNYSSEPVRRLDISLTIGRDSDMALAEKVLAEALHHHPMALAEPEPSVKVTGHSDLGTVVTCRVWAKNEDYWNMNYDLQQQLKEALDRAGIEMPVRTIPPVQG